MPFFQKGDVRIRYEETGSGFPLLVTPGGGLNSRVRNWPTAVINAMEEFKNDFRCITMDQRNANGGESTGPVQVDNPWDAFADDQLGLMDHLGIHEFFYMGYCIGGCFAGKLMQRAPDRVVAAILCRRTRSRNTCTTCTQCSPISCTASRANSSETAARRCWYCRMTYRGIPCRPRLMSPRWRRTPRSLFTRGRSRRS